MTNISTKPSEVSGNLLQLTLDNSVNKIFFLQFEAQGQIQQLQVVAVDFVGVEIGSDRNTHNEVRGHALEASRISGWIWWNNFLAVERRGRICKTVCA